MAAKGRRGHKGILFLCVPLRSFAARNLCRRSRARHDHGTNARQGGTRRRLAALPVSRRAAGEGRTEGGRHRGHPRVGVRGSDQLHARLQQGDGRARQDGNLCLLHAHSFLRRLPVRASAERAGTFAARPVRDALRLVARTREVRQHRAKLGEGGVDGRWPERGEKSLAAGGRVQGADDRVWLGRRTRDSLEGIQARCRAGAGHDLGRGFRPQREDARRPARGLVVPRQKLARGEEPRSHDVSPANRSPFRPMASAGSKRPASAE